MEVLRIRNSEPVKRSMYTDHEISGEEHLQYIDRLCREKQQRVFSVLSGTKKAVGVISISKIDFLHKKLDWAFYLDENERGGLGSRLELLMLDYVFLNLGMEKLNCEVIESNVSVVEMHKKFGFSVEGFRKSNIEKEGTRMGVHFLGITKADWVSIRNEKIDVVTNRTRDIEVIFEE